MSTKPNHNKKKVIVRPDQTVEGTSFEGIMPDPETLKEYELLCPGSTKKWMDLAESEIKMRQQNEDRITWTFKVSTILGQLLGFTSSALIFAVGCYSISKGFPTQGAAIITGSAASVIMAYWFRSKSRDNSK
ncbi:MAG: DUF2335 domain-containing protein [Chitinophagales bacterium]